MRLKYYVLACIVMVILLASACNAPSTKPASSPVPANSPGVATPTTTPTTSTQNPNATVLSTTSGTITPGNSSNLGITPLVGQTPIPAQAAGNVYYVAKNGSNSNPGTEAQPWLTIQKAASTMVAGDTVYVKAGTYNEHVVPAHSGSSGSPITYKNYGSDEVTINGSGLSLSNDTQGIFEIKGSPSGASTPLNYIIVDGFEICNANSSGVVIYGETHYITLRNLTIHDVKWCGILATYNYHYTSGKCTNITIDSCEVFDTNYGIGDEAVSLVAVSNFEIKNCIVHDTSSIAIDMKVGTTRGSVHDCEVYSAGSGIYIDARDADADSISIYNNVCHDISDSAGIIFESEDIGHGINDLSVYNNIVYECNNGIYFGNHGSQLEYVSFVVANNTLYNNVVGITLRQTYDHYSGVIRNNIIYGTSGSQNFLVYASYNDTSKTDPAGNVIIDHNLFYNPAGYPSVDKYGTNSIKANPLLVSPTSNFSISSGSPAIDAGSSDDAPSFDYANASRPQGAGYDIGASEFASGSSTPTPIPTPTPTPTPDPVTATFGLNSGDQTWNQTPNVLDAMRFQNTAGTGTLNKLEVLLDTSAPSGKVRLGIYADSNGKPGNLLLNAGEATISNGWVSISSLSLPVTQNSYYWLSFIMSAGNVVDCQTGQASNSHYWLSYNYGALPSIYPTSGISTNSCPYVMRATVSVP
jgi:hypothetical protein